MVSKTQHVLNGIARYVQKPALALVRPQPLARIVFDLNARLLNKTPAGLRQNHQMLEAGGGRVRGPWLDLGGDTDGGVVLYLHGGAFMIGSLRAYRHLVARLADAAGMAGLYVEYRLAPGHPFPAAADDALTAYKALLALGHAPGRIVLAGDSAGGCLALSLLHRIGAAGLPMPGAVALLLPIVDLTGALPVMVQVCDGEIFQDESHRMADVLRAQGVPVRLDEGRGVPHVWHLDAGRSPEADRARADVAGVLRESMAARRLRVVPGGEHGNTRQSRQERRNDSPDRPDHSGPRTHQHRQDALRDRTDAGLSHRHHRLAAALAGARGL
jgi:acetyl esterase/lipase